ncbi:MAG: SgcJ/EcaC family oxidoreductase [Deinococcales bacterium]|jgi:uncharacterized protein (TIGR02246 family)
MTRAPGLEGEIAAANAAFAAAFERQDATALAHLYTEGGCLLPAHRDALEGRPAIEAFWRELMESGMRRLQLELVEVDSIGESAYEVGRYTLEDERGTADEGKVLVIWKREGGQWRLHRAIWNTRRPAS